MREGVEEKVEVYLGLLHLFDIVRDSNVLGDCLVCFHVEALDTIRPVHLGRETLKYEEKENRTFVTN